MDLREWCLVLSVVAAGLLSLTPVTAGVKVTAKGQGTGPGPVVADLKTSIAWSDCHNRPVSYTLRDCSRQFELVIQKDFDSLSEHLHFQVKRIHGLESANQSLKQELSGLQREVLALREDHLKAIAALHSQALSAEALAEIRQQVQSIVQQELERAR